MKAVWKDIVIAESDNTIIIEGNHYFPPSDVKDTYLTKSETTSVCPWKGTASYYSLKVSDELNKDAAWYYPQPKPKAKEIEGYIAFWKGVKITE